MQSLPPIYFLIEKYKLTSEAERQHREETINISMR